MPTEAELQLRKLALTRVESVSLGDIDTSGRSLGRAATDTAHGFTDMAVSMRRGLTSLKEHLNENNGVTGSAETYARSSMDEWTRRTHGIVNGHPEASAYLKQAIRSVYDNWRAQVTPELTPEAHTQQAWATLKRLHRLSENTGTTGVRVYDQGTGLSPRDALNELGYGALHSFAYRMNPTVRRSRDPSGEMSRLSLNFDADQGPAFAQRINEVVQANPTHVRQSKIMGPANIGKRVDDAVVYLGMGKPSRELAVAADRVLRQGMTPPVARAAPPGMLPISRISSYAEYMPGTSSSHGTNRGKIVQEAILGRLSGRQGSLSTLTGQALARHGYNPEQPHSIQRQQAHGSNARHGDPGSNVLQSAQGPSVGSQTGASYPAQAASAGITGGKNGQ